MATSGTVSSKDYNGAHFEIEWSSTQTGAGSTKRTWSLYSRGRSEAPRWYLALGTIKIHNTTIDIKSLARAEWDNIVNFNNQLLKTGSFTITHNAQGAGSFLISYNIEQIYNFGVEDSSHTISLNTNYPYTNCEAPTSVTIAQTIQKPGASITINWSGAAPGTANSISGYSVQYRIGSGSWTGTTAARATATSVSISLPNTATRGATVQARVKTLGTQSGYDSGYKASAASCKINTVPSKPTVTISIPSGGGSNELKIPYGKNRQITATAGSANDTNQTALVYYSVDGGNSKTKYTGAITVNTSKTYTFYTYDGLEYSTGVSKTFVYNTSAPTVSVGSISVTTLSSSNKGSATYAINPSITASKQGGQSSGNTYTFSLLTSTEKDGTYGSPVTLQSGTSASWSTSDIRQFKAPTTSSGYYYKIQITRNDGIQTCSTTTGAYYVTKIPGCTVYNDLTTPEKISDHKFFSNKIKVTLDSDSGYTSTEIKMLNASGTVAYSKTNTSTSSWFDLSSLARGANYTIQVKPKSANYTPSAFQTKETAYKITLPYLATSQSTPNIGGGGLINPFTSPQKDLVFINFFNKSSSSITDTIKKQYGINPSGANEGLQIKITASYGTNKKTITKNFSLSSQSNCKVELTNGDYKNLFDSLGINKNSVASSTVTIKLSLTTRHGDSITASFSQKVCYVTDGTIPEISGFTVTPLGPSNQATNQLKFLCQSCKIKVSNITFSNKHHDINKIRVQIGSSDLKTVIMDTTQTITSLSDGITLTLPAISTDISSVYVQIRVTSAASQTSNAYIKPTNLKAKKLVAGTGKLVFKKWDNNKVQVQYQLTNPGYVPEKNNSKYGKISSRLYYGASDTAVDLSGNQEYFFNDANLEQSNNTADSPEFTQPNISGANYATWSSGYQSLRVKNTSYLCPIDGVSVSITWYTAAIIIYKSSPTLSYRKNKVGVNFDFSKGSISEPSFVVGEHEGSKHVYFWAATNTAKITLQNGAMDGFVIDCGTW